MNFITNYFDLVISHDDTGPRVSPTVDSPMFIEIPPIFKIIVCVCCLEVKQNGNTLNPCKMDFFQWTSHYDGRFPQVPISGNALRTIITRSPLDSRYN